MRAQITGAPLEDARHLTHRYDKLRQEVEAQVIIYVLYYLGVNSAELSIAYLIVNIFSLGR